MEEIFHDIPLKRDAPLSDICTFRIGGMADYLLMPKTKEQLVGALRTAEERGIRYTVVGNGSNLLFSDEGYRGAVILTSALRRAEFSEDGTVTAECGVSVTALAHEAAERGLSGLEFAYGIPGSVGGAGVMNAGAYGGQTSDVLVNSECFDPKTGELRRLSAEEHRYGYRESIYLEHPELAFLSAVLKLDFGDRAEIKEKSEANMRARREKQPLEYPSAGSVFKRPTGYFAGALLEGAGLKGKRIGGAAVSDKHAGFIVNLGGATCSDVLSLIDFIKDDVLTKFGVELECEVKYIPEK